jgi:hypothetical protein
MAYVQTQFEQFNNAIRLGRFDENQTLREKRDIIRDILKERLPSVFEKHGEVCPQFYFRDQGSYDMDMGAKPLDGDYDRVWLFRNDTELNKINILQRNMLETRPLRG